MGSLERQKRGQNVLLSEINALDSAAYGGINSYNQNTASYDTYGSTYSKTSPKLAPPPPPPGYSHYSLNDTTQVQKTYSPTSQYNYVPTSSSPYSSLENTYWPSTSNNPPKPPSKFDYSSFNTVDIPLKVNEYKSLNSGPSGGAGYVTSEVTTNTYKLPDGYKTDTYKYETYQSSSEPLSYTITEKYYTSSPDEIKRGFNSPTNKNDGFKNGSNSDLQGSYIMETYGGLVSKDGTSADTMEHRMMKKMVSQHVTEKKTVQTVKSTRQETASRNFKFE